MAGRNNGIPRRIDIELDELIREIAKKNEISMKQASRELARISRAKIKGERTSREIIF